MNKKKLFWIYLIAVAPFYIICFLLILTGKVTIQYQGFGIDSNEVVYVGKQRQIQKIYNNNVVATINPRTSRGYAFTVQNNDTILLSTSSTVYTLNLEGEVISKQEDIDTSTLGRQGTVLCLDKSSLKW